MISGMTRSCFLILFGLFFIGCQNDYASQYNKMNCEPGTSLVNDNCIDFTEGESPDSGQGTLTDTTKEQSLQKKFFSKMNQACIAATGRPLSADMQCQCMDVNSDQLSGIFNAKTKSCVDLTIDDFNRSEQEICINKGHQRVLADEGPSGLNKCLQGIRTLSENPIIGTDLSIRLTHSASDLDASKLADWADQQLKSSRPFFAKLWRPAGSGDQASVYTGAVSGSLFSDVSFDSLLSQHIFTRHNDQAGNTIFFYEPDPSQLDLMLGRRLSIPDINRLWPMPETSRVRIDSATENLYRAFRSFEGKPDFELSKGTPLDGLGCEDVCLVYRTPFQVDSHKAIVSRIYSGGSVLKQTLWLLDSSNRLIGAVLYGLNGYPSFYLTIQWNTADNNLKVNLSLYDRTFTYLQGVKSRVISDISSVVRRVIFETSQLNEIPDRSGVIVCEHFDPLSFEPMDRLVRGAYPSRFSDRQLISGSVWGWQPNSNGAWNYGLGGFRENPFQIFPGTIEHSYHHAKEVSEIILSGSSNSFLLPAGKCFYEASYTRHILEQGKVLTTSLKDQKISVLNASFAIQESSISCQDKFDPVFNELENKIVLVMGAGNSGKENPQNCPQSVRKQNTIVVAGADQADSKNPRRWGKSDYGVRYADIAAAYGSLNGNSGTSFAAPRVSAVASDLAINFQNLTPRDIRLAILASAWVPYKSDLWGFFKRWEPLPVSSGGVLRKDSALGLGRCLSEKRRLSGSLLMSKEQVRGCLIDSDIYSLKMASAKIDFLSNRGIF